MRVSGRRGHPGSGQRGLLETDLPKGGQVGMGSQGSGADESEPRGPQVSQCREVAGGTSSSGVCLEQSTSTLHVLMVTLLAEGQPWNQTEKSLPPLVSLSILH